MRERAVLPLLAGPLGARTPAARDGAFATVLAAGGRRWAKAEIMVAGEAGVPQEFGVVSL